MAETEDLVAEIEALGERGSASQTIKIIAPQDGIVATLSVREGMFIQPNTTIMSLADLSSHVLEHGVDPQPRSGRQEMLENRVNRYL